MVQTGPGARRASSARVASPEVTKAFQLSRGTPSASNCATTSDEGRGELEIRTTWPPLALKSARAVHAVGQLSRPLWITPQTSHSRMS
jgi:hypothetical protein